MATHTTQWSPDTCACVVTYTWDDAVPPEQRVHTPAQVVQRCPAHQGLTDVAVHTALTEENPRKNKFHARALQQLTGTKFTKAVTLQDGTASVDWADGVTLDWHFDASRVLVVSIVGLTATQKTQLQAAADNLLGAGKVRVQ